ncbi:uncharacterized protein LOC143201068 [Rhynchophorus ferrugineus]|uniref:Tubulin epsilon and delta complex protein 1 domain-containing protein n=1 Tax=Rhynchophorus ferrugineus TaxID=354439 RepID=A0A834IT08_RHYFE|nr:hypothetical protein GWI33_022179 [Rhynchophorus ferrugineus]
MSQEIKNTIGILCKVLNLVYKVNLKPEHFRLAKFNKNDENVVEVLWNVIFKILNESDIAQVKNKLKQLNYERREFFNVLYETVCSRELLLALAFIISVSLKECIEKVLDKSVFSASYDGFKENLDLIPVELIKLNEKDVINYKKWISGKICLNNNMIFEYNEQVKKMYEKISNSIDMKANGSLTIYELLALKDKSYAEKFFSDSEPMMNLLSFYTEWLKKEKIFWKWMITVLNEEKKMQSK